MSTTRRQGASPSMDDLATFNQPTAGGRLRKAPTADPVLGVASGTTTTENPPPAAATKTTPRGAPATPTKAKVGFYQAPADTARARAAYDWTRTTTRHRSFSDFIATALMREVARLEADHHDGQPWPALDPGELPTGKPLGS